MDLLNKPQTVATDFQIHRLAESELPLQRIYSTFLGPVHGQVTEWTWGSAMQEVRKIAGCLKAQDWPPVPTSSFCRRTCAWWIVADFESGFQGM
jgi:hypothetical protein